MGVAEVELEQSHPWDGFNQKGPNLEMAFSMALSDEYLSKLIILMAYERTNGDTEILLSDLLAVPLKAGGTAANYIEVQSRGNITALELNDFAATYPSTIVAIRGNPVSWLQGTHQPPVKFVPYDFSEQTTSTTALQAGSPVTLDLSRPFSDAVVVLMKSERHNERGELVPQSGQAAGGRMASPQISASDVGGNGVLSALSCDPEPTACPTVEPTLNSFSATTQNGGVFLTYNVSDWPSELCTWGRVKIDRLNPDGSIRTFWRFANEPTSFYDDTGDPNITYTYTAEAYIAFLSNATSGWVTCPSNPNTISSTVTYPAAGAIVDTYEGSNQASTTIRYDWILPAGVFADKIRIRRSTASGFVTLDDNIPANTTSYFYTDVPSHFRGQRVETQIQYKASGPWQGAFYDRTFASFREPGEPLYFNGIRMDLTEHEYSENPLYGSPEIHLSALQANVSGGTNEIVSQYLPMSGCQQQTPTTVVVPSITFWPFGIFFISFNLETIILETNNGLFYPTEAPEGYPILNSWDSYLFSSAVTVNLFESDAGVPSTTGTTTTQTESHQVSANVGIKKGILEVGSVGVTSDWEEAVETTVEYPVDPLPVGASRLIYYHEPRTLVKGTALFSTQAYSTYCQVLQHHL